MALKRLALEIGMQATANDGFDDGIDEVPGGGTGLGEANLEQGSRLYRTDVRGTAESADWEAPTTPSLTFEAWRLTH